MKKYSILLCVLFIIFFFSKIVNSQSDGPRESKDWLINPRWEFYSDNMISAVNAGKGYSGIGGLGDVSSLNLNPASVNIEKKFQVYAGSMFKTNISYYYYTYFINEDSLRNYSPSLFLGGIYRVNKYFQTGFIYRNDYGYKDDRYVFDIFSSGYKLKNKLLTHTFTVPVVFNYNWLRAGVNLNLSYFKGESIGGTSEYEPEGNLTYNISLLRFIPQFGIIISPIPNLSFGATYTPGFSDTSKWNPVSGITKESKMPVTYPWRLGVGTEWRLLKDRLKLSFDYHYEKTSGLPDLKDKSNFNLGVEYQTENNFTIRGGFFTLLDFRDFGSTVTTDGDNLLDQYFITLGGTYKLKSYSFSLAIMDSYLTKFTEVSQTRFIGGVSLDL